MVLCIFSLKNQHCQNSIDTNAGIGIGALLALTFVGNLVPGSDLLVNL